jgi:hypothetical protein
LPESSIRLKPDPWITVCGATNYALTGPRFDDNVSSLTKNDGYMSGEFKGWYAVAHEQPVPNEDSGFEQCGLSQLR